MLQNGFAVTWKINLANFDIPPVTKNQILTIETGGVNDTMREELVNDRDERIVIAVKGNFDGRDNPVTGTPFSDTVSYCLMDSHTIEGTAKKDRRICVKETAVLSEDEAVVCVKYKSYDERGNVQIAHSVFERNTSLS